MVLVDFGMLFFSILLLCWAGDLAVHYTLEVATVYRMTKLFGGFVLLAISTGLPELSVAISSVYGGVVQISVGNIIGSNVVDITLVLGVVLLMAKKIAITKKDAFNSVLMLLVSCLAMAFVFYLGTITTIAGFMLVIIYVGCLVWIWRNGIACSVAVKEIPKKEFINPEVPLVDIIDEKSHIAFWGGKLGVVIKFIGSMILVFVASHFTVKYAVEVCKDTGLSYETLGTAIMSIGTSLPELMLGVASIRRKEYCLALGNSLGSVLMQGTLIIGLQGIISSHKPEIYPVRWTMPFMFLAFATIGFGLIKRKKLDRVEGAILLAIFIAFFAYQIIFVG